MVIRDRGRVLQNGNSKSNQEKQEVCEKHKNNVNGIYLKHWGFILGGFIIRGVGGGLLGLWSAVVGDQSAESGGFNFEA